MENLSSMFDGESLAKRFDVTAMLKTNDISAPVQAHLKKVYQCLACGVLAASVGTYAHLQYNLGGFVTLLGTIGCLLLLSGTPDQGAANFEKRAALFGGMCFFKGCSIGGLVEHALFMDPSLVVIAFLGTTLSFACFSGAAILSRRRSYLYLGGMLSSALSFLFLMSIANMFFRSSAAMTLQLWLGLLVFCGYIVFDTQLVVEQAINGRRDFISDAVQLFTDLVAVFVRVLMLLMKNAGEKKRKKDRREY